MEEGELGGRRKGGKGRERGHGVEGDREKGAERSLTLEHLVGHDGGGGREGGGGRVASTHDVYSPRGLGMLQWLHFSSSEDNKNNK